jgi:hypothetical protein
VLLALGPGMTFLAPALCAIFPTFPLPAINLIIKFISQRLAQNTQNQYTCINILFKINLNPIFEAF